MPPLRFKAVCTETGREIDAFINDTINRFYSNPFRMELVIDQGFELCQSTGLTDSRGQEVYEGDVLYDIGGSEIEDEDIIGNMRIIEFDGIGFDFFCYFDSSRDDGYKDFHRYLSHHVVIGNRFMPQAELQARAEAVSNDKA